MDPIDLLELCRRCSQEGASCDLVVPRLFGVGEFEQAWRQDPKRVRQCFDETLTGAFPGLGLELLLRSGAFFALVPELQALRNLGDDPTAVLHKDVWEHTKQVVAGVPNQLELRWSALLHDVGKAGTRRIYPNGKVTFHNHDMVGARMVDQINRRLGLFADDDSLHRTVRSLVLNHLRPAGYKNTWTDSSVRRLLTDLGGLHNFERLMMLSRADLTTKNPAKRERALARGRELEARVMRIYTEDTAPKLPKGTMGIIMTKVPAKPGRWLNDLRDKLESMMACGILPADRETEYYVNEGLKLVEQVADEVD